MNFKVLLSVIAIAITMGKSNECVSAPLHDGGPKENKLNHPHKCPKPNSKPQVSYNSASTVLSVSFHGNRQGGKVEIFRNGAKVINISASAGTSLSYVLLNYGKGDYTVIVSSGNTVVYSGSYNVE